MTHTATGAAAFDFVIGRWSTTNRKRIDPLDPNDAEWLEFNSTGEHRALPGGGNLETYETSSMPGLGEFHGLALRLYEPASDTWRIWWNSSTTPGKLDPPMEGRFNGTHGEFFADDVVNDQSVKVRFEWDDLGPDAARWQQAFSHDGGTTWDINWVMDMVRTA
jgi:hypothetical protein